MIEYQQKKVLRKVMYSKITLSILFIVLVVFAHSTYKLWQKQRDTKKALTNMKTELETLTQKHSTLQVRVEGLKTDKGVEEAIREKFKVAKQGEGVVVVIDQKDTGEDPIPDNPIRAFLFRVFGI